MVLRVIAQGTVIVLDSSKEILLVDAAERPHFIGADHIGIALDGFRAVGLGAVVVVEVVLGHTPEEPRLIEPRLLADGLIEVLDGEHVVLVIEG